MGLAPGLLSGGGYPRPGGVLKKRETDVRVHSGRYRIPGHDKWRGTCSESIAGDLGKGADDSRRMFDEFEAHCDGLKVVASPAPPNGLQSCCKVPNRPRQLARAWAMTMDGRQAVSYTHLTLPTILLV